MKKHNTPKRGQKKQKTIFAILVSSMLCVAIIAMMWNQRFSEQKREKFSKLMKTVENLAKFPNDVQIEIIKDSKDPQIKKCENISELKNWENFQWIEVEIPSCNMFGQQIFVSVSRHNKNGIDAHLNLHEKGDLINSGKSCLYGYGVGRLIPDPGFNPNSSGSEAYAYMLNTRPPLSPSKRELKKLQLDAIEMVTTTIKELSSHNSKKIVKK